MTRVRHKRATLGSVMLVFASFGLSRCSSPTAATTTVTVTRLSNGASAFWMFSGYAQPATVVIRNAQDLATAWATIYANTPVPPPPPAVDFAKETIVGVALGTQPNANKNVVITGATETNGTVTVGATVTTLDSSCAVLAIVTSPIDVARVETLAGAVNVVLTQKTASCP